MKERKRGEELELVEQVRADELERAAWLKSPEFAASLAPIHARWLARQSLDHPWRVVRERGAA